MAGIQDHDDNVILLDLKDNLIFSPTGHSLLVTDHCFYDS